MAKNEGTNTLQNSLQKDTLDFDRVLSTPQNRLLFKEYLITNHTEELLEFLDDVTIFEQTEQASKLPQQVDYIINTYLLHNSPKGLNISYEDFIVPVLAEYQKCLEEKKEIRKSIFQKIKLEVLKTLKFDSFPRFTKTKYFEQMSTSQKENWAFKAKNLVKTIFKRERRSSAISPKQERPKKKNLRFSIHLLRRNTIRFPRYPTL